MKFEKHFMDDKKFWVGFNLIKGIGAVRMQGLVAYFGDLESAWRASPPELAQAGLGLKVIERVVQARASVNLEKSLGENRKAGNQNPDLAGRNLSTALERNRSAPACAVYPWRISSR